MKGVHKDGESMVLRLCLNSLLSFSPFETLLHHVVNHVHRESMSASSKVFLEAHN